MRYVLCAVLAVVGAGAAVAQEAIPREQALKAAFTLCNDLPQMLDTPIPTDPDVKRPVGVHEAERGLLILPESKLSLDGLAKAGAEVVPVGQLWMRGVALLADAQPVKAEKLHVVKSSGGNEAGAMLFALGVRGVAAGKGELLIYGKQKEPVLSVPLEKATDKADKQENPIEVAAELQGDTATVTLRILGGYKGHFTVGVGQ